MPRRQVGLLAAAAGAAVVLGVASTLVLAALSGVFAGPGLSTSGYGVAAASGQAACPAPALPGSVVDVRLSDMGAMMGGGPGPGAMDGPYRGGFGPGGVDDVRPARAGAGWMDMTVGPAQVEAGQVALRVTNLGWRPHELVVLPLAAGQGIGQRVVGADGKVDESGSLGEASASCAAGTGEGIVPGATGWTTATLAPGRYELVCNFPGHYRAGMYAELDVT